MGCNHDKFNNCVCDILLDIVEEQEKVNNYTGQCASGCATSLSELCGDMAGNRPTTIPVSLICKDGCSFFIGAGVRRNPNNPNDLLAFESIAFRVVDVDPETCCAVLELLQPISPEALIPSGGSNPAAVTDDYKRQVLLRMLTADPDFPGGGHGYSHTGVCITVDLNCFCGVHCHPATTPTGFRMPRTADIVAL